MSKPRQRSNASRIKRRGRSRPARRWMARTRALWMKWAAWAAANESSLDYAALLEQAVIQHGELIVDEGGPDEIRFGPPLPDPVIKAIEQINGLDGSPLEYETRVLLDLAKEAQGTGVMPDLSVLTKPLTEDGSGLASRSWPRALQTR